MGSAFPSSEYSPGSVTILRPQHTSRTYIFSYAIDGLSAAGLRVLLHPILEEDEQDIYDRILWSSKDATEGAWKRAEILYTYNKEHQVVTKLPVT